MSNPAFSRLTRCLNGRLRETGFMNSKKDFIGLLPQRKTAWVSRSMLYEHADRDNKDYVKVEYYEEEY